MPGTAGSRSGGAPGILEGMPAPEDRPATTARPDVLALGAVVLGLVCALCLALLLVLEAAGADPWDGLTVIPWFAFPVAFLLLCASLVRALRHRRRA